MEKLIVHGGKTLQGKTRVSGAKNVALKALVAACMTKEIVTIENVPLISDVFVMFEIIKYLGGTVKLSGHTAVVQLLEIKKTKISLDIAVEVRTSSMFLAPLLARMGEAIIPNPGGCRIGARPIDRIVKGLEKMGVAITYDRSDGYFYTKTEKLRGASYAFEKNTHMGTETLILTAVLAQGKTVLTNAAQEPEVDELIAFLNAMGGKITRENERTISIEGVLALHGATLTIGPDRNEVVTLAIAALMTKGSIEVEGIQEDALTEFIEKFEEVGGGITVEKNGIIFFYKDQLRPTDVQTSPYPGFMTDWQAPWTLLMTQANGISTVHETVYENRFAYVSELRKLGAKIELFNPEVQDPETLYNFNFRDDDMSLKHAAKITGPKTLHNGVVFITDLRAGATLVLAALAAKGESVIFGIEHLDRGYEQFDKRLNALGADIVRMAEDQVV